MTMMVTTPDQKSKLTHLSFLYTTAATPVAKEERSDCHVALRIAQSKGALLQSN